MSVDAARDSLVFTGRPQRQAFGAVWPHEEEQRSTARNVRGACCKPVPLPVITVPLDIATMPAHSCTLGRGVTDAAHRTWHGMGSR